MKSSHNHRLYPVLVSSDEDGQEGPTAQDEHEEDEDTADEDALHSNSNLGPSEPEIRIEPNSIYERRKAQVMLQRKWTARRQRARERQRSSEAEVLKYSLWQRSAKSIAMGVVVGIALAAVLLWNREERLSGVCLYLCHTHMHHTVLVQCLHVCTCSFVYYRYV